MILHRCPMACLGLAILTATGSGLSGKVLADPADTPVVSSSVHDAWRPFPARFLGWDGVIRQSGRSTCGATALAMLAGRLGVTVPAGRGEPVNDAGAGGASLLSVQAAARNIGIALDGWRLRWEALPGLAPLIVLYSAGHYVVIDSASEAGDVWLRDPSAGRWWIRREVLERLWRGEALVPRRTPGAGGPSKHRTGPSPVDQTETLPTGGKHP